MKIKSIKGYVYVVLSGVYLALATILVLSNLGVRLGEQTSVTFFWTQLEHVSIGVLMLISAGAGLVLLWMLKVLWVGIKAIRAGRIEADADEMARIRKAGAKAKSDSPAVAETPSSSVTGE